MRKRHKGHYDAKRYGVLFEVILFSLGVWKLYAGACEVLTAPTKEACVVRMNKLCKAECKMLQARSAAIRAAHSNDDMPF